MKFAEFPYERPDLSGGYGAAGCASRPLPAPQQRKKQKCLPYRLKKITERIGSLSAICYIRHTVDTRDPFYEKENAFWDENLPFSQIGSWTFTARCFSCPHRPELEKELGKLLFDKMEIDVKSADPSILSLMQEENRLQTEYQQLYASAQIPLQVRPLTVAQLAPYKQDLDRAVRKSAFEAEGRFFDENREKFDEILR